MSRSGYTDDYDEDGTGGLWRGAVQRAIKGKRGQTMLRELLAALDAMPEKALVADSLATADGEFCALGALGARRGIDLDKLDPDDWDGVASTFGVAPSLVREIVYENDEHIGEHEWVTVEICGPVRPYWPEFGRHTKDIRVDVENVAQRRWEHMRAWVAAQVGATPPTAAEGQPNGNV